MIKKHTFCLSTRVMVLVEKNKSFSHINLLFNNLRCIAQTSILILMVLEFYLFVCHVHCTAIIGTISITSDLKKNEHCNIYIHLIKGWFMNEFLEKV